MSEKKVPDYTNIERSSKDKLNKTDSSNLMTNFNDNAEHAYLPKMRTDYTPSDESVESATGVDFPVNMPNPVVDPIVSNNISNAEFDYTEDMISPDNYDLDKD